MRQNTHQLSTSFVLFAALLATGCTGRADGGGTVEPDARIGDQLDAPSAVLLPTWMLEDVQPMSPRNGQTYGLDTFTNKSVVVVLLEGF